LDHEHQLHHAKANAIIAQKLAAALTIFLWNRRVRMRWWFDDQAEQRRRISAAQTILLWNRRLRMRWWFDEQTRQRQNGLVVTGSSKLDTRGLYGGVNTDNNGSNDNDGLDNNDGLCNGQRFYHENQTINYGGLYNDVSSKLLSKLADKQQCGRVAMVVHACVDSTTFNNGTAMEHRCSKPRRRTSRRHQPWAPNSHDNIAEVTSHNDVGGLYDDNGLDDEGSDDGGSSYNNDEGQLYDDGGNNNNGSYYDGELHDVGLNDNEVLNVDGSIL
jgi:hypothetical protein